MLLDADASARTNEGKAPRDAAEATGHLRIVDLLDARGRWPESESPALPFGGKRSTRETSTPPDIHQELDLAGQQHETRKSLTIPSHR